MSKTGYPGNWYELAGREAEAESARVIIIPAPYEGSVCFGGGASRGPAAMFAASQLVEQLEPELQNRPCRIGIAGLPPLRLQKLKPKAAAAKVETAVRAVLRRGKKPVVLGGEHSLSAGAVKACAEAHPGLSVLHLDAHADLRDEYHGEPYSHASIMRRVHELGIRFVSAGIRSLSEEEWDLIRDQKLEVYFAHDLVRVSGWQEMAVRSLADQVYVTLDLDVLDPSEMPGTGTPEPGGLHYYELLELFKTLGRSGKNVVGLDLVELAPLKGQSLSEFTAARLLYQMIGWLWAK